MITIILMIGCFVCGVLFGDKIKEKIIQLKDKIKGLI